jgi:hypothetical protein
VRRPGTPLFLQRGPYRQRRRADAARLLPVAGLFLLLLPMLWEPADGSGRPTSLDGIYLFVVWALLILAARILAPGLGRGEDGAARREPFRPAPDGPGGAGGDGAG